MKNKKQKKKLAEQSKTHSVFVISDGEYFRNQSSMI